MGKDMDTEAFKKLYIGEFIISDKEKKLHNLAAEYHEETETYDKKVCGGRNDRNVAIPIDRYEMALINRNAQSVFKRLLNKNPDIEREELHRAISRYH